MNYTYKNRKTPVKEILNEQGSTIGYIARLESIVGVCSQDMPTNYWKYYLPKGLKFSPWIYKTRKEAIAALISATK